MLSDVINDPGLASYVVTYDIGKSLFYEGDKSEDLYILVSGELDVIKGKQRIAEISEPGSLFGEMSFFLGAKRTATLKARSPVKAICIPKDEATAFLNKFPNVAREITKLLAQRLDEASQVLYGLKEFCDQLPDAVILSDREGRILTWNAAAEKLYGWEWDEVKDKSVEEIYEKPQHYRSFLNEVQSKESVREKTLPVRHPQKGIRFISTSMTILYDGHHNVQGVLSLGRDVTEVTKLEKRYRRVRYWLIPSISLLLVLAGAIFYGYPHFARGKGSLDFARQGLKNHLAKDYALLKSMLAKSIPDRDRYQSTPIMEEFFSIQKGTVIPYTGLVLLDKDKKVWDAYSVKEGLDESTLLGSSYGGISFRGGQKSPHSVLTVYRANEEHPMGWKAVEVAFELEKGGRFLGWLVFQMDMDLVQREFRVDEEDLKAFQFSGF